MDFSQIGWSEMLLMALIGFLMVFFILVLLIFVMKAFGYTFSRKPKSKEIKQRMDAFGVEDEVVAAIITSLRLYRSALHDKESELLTIQRMNRAYSPWNSKIHGLTQMPERR